MSIRKDHPSIEAEVSVQSSESLNSVMGEELQAKIEENAKLKLKLSDIDAKYEGLVAALQSQIKDLEQEMKRKAQFERAEDNKQKDLAQGLRAENKALMEQIQQLEGELIDHQDKITLLTVQLESTNSSPRHTGQVQGQGKAGQAHRANLNFPLDATDARVQSVELLSQFSESVTDIVAGLSDFHTYWEHRIKDSNVDGSLTDSASSLSKLLLQNVKHLKPLEASFQSSLSQVLCQAPEDARAPRDFFKDFAKSIKDYVSYSSNLEPLTVSCLQYESNHYSCTPTQQAKNSQFQGAIRSWNRTLARLSDHIDAIAGTNSEEASEAVENINVVLQQLQKQANDLAKTYDEKAKDESNLPTVTDQLKNTNQCILASLISLNTSLGRLSRQVADALPRIVMLIATPTQTLHPRKLDSEVVNAEATDGVTDEEVSALKTELAEMQEQKEELGKEIKDLTDKIKKLEQGQEHWKLECQLLEMKCNKLKASSNDTINTDVEQLLSDQEKALKQPFQDRLDELVTERLVADSKAITFQVECKTLQKRLRAAEHRHSILEQELAKAKADSHRLQDEVGVTASNYEGQLTLMTEHVARMNDKLTSQTDEIENLRYQLNKKGKK